MTWSKEQIATLHKLVKQKLSSGQMARQMGLSRSAVCGKLSRLNISIESAAAAARIERRAAKKAKVAKPPVKRSTVPVVGMRDVEKNSKEPVPKSPVHTMPDSGFCKWVHGDPSSQSWRCCGHATDGIKLSFCAHHHARAFHKAPAIAPGKRARWKGPV